MIYMLLSIAFMIVMFNIWLLSDYLIQRADTPAPYRASNSETVIICLVFLTVGFILYTGQKFEDWYNRDV